MNVLRQVFGMTGQPFRNCAILARSGSFCAPRDCSNAGLEAGRAGRFAAPSPPRDLGPVGVEPTAVDGVGWPSRTGRRRREMEQLLAKAYDLGTVFGVRILTALLILIVGRWMARALRTIIRRALERAKIEATVASFFSNLGYGVFLTFVILAALAKLGIQTTSFIAVLGAAGLAVGLALQGSLANFAAGVLLLVFRPLRVGDYVEGAGVSGKVDEIHIFTTSLATPDNKRVIIPNAKLMNDNITNYTILGQRRVDLTIGVGYGENLARVKEVIADVLAGDERILTEPAPTIGVLALASSSVDFVVRPWVKSEDYWDVFFATNQRLKERFDQEGISIPFPQRDVHVYQAATNAEREPVGAAAPRLGRA
jgi:small conductance mechanosensitive channel